MKRPFWLGIWYVVPVTRQIISEDAESVLEPELMSVLLLLARHGGEVVALDDLIANAWDGVDVGYNVLADSIIKLREHLGDDPKNPQYIETVAQKGYRLRARVQYRAPTNVNEYDDNSVGETGKSSVGMDGNGAGLPPVTDELFTRKKSARQRLYTDLFGSGNSGTLSVPNERYAYYLIALVFVIAIALYSVFSEPDSAPLPSRVENTSAPGSRISTARTIAKQRPILPSDVLSSRGATSRPGTSPSLARETSVQNQGFQQELKQGSVQGKVQNALHSRPTSSAAEPLLADAAGQLHSNISTSRNQNYRPAVIIQPFDDLSNESGQRYLSEGISTALGYELSHYSGLRMVSHRQLDQSRHQSADIENQARQLGVRYLLQGDVRRDGDNLLINVHLKDLAEVSTIWQERYNRVTADIFKIQDAIRKQVLDTLAIDLTQQEDAASGNDMSGNFAAYDAYLHGQYLLRQGGSATAYRKAQSFMEKAVTLDPGFVQAHISLAIIHADNFLAGRDDPAVNAKRAQEEAEQAVALNQNSALANWALGYVYLYVKGNHQQAIEMSERAIDLESDNVAGYTLLSDAHAFGGSPEKARLLLEGLKRDKQEYHSQVPSTLGLANLLLGNYRASIQSLNESLSMDSSYVQGNVYKLIALYRMGDLDDAHTQAKQLFTLHPDFDAKAWASRQPFKDKHIRDGMMDDLEKITRL